MNLVSRRGPLRRLGSRLGLPKFPGQPPSPSRSFVPKMNLLRFIRLPLDVSLYLTAPALRFIVRRNCRNLSLHYGFRLSSRVPDGINRELIESRVIAALKTLDDSAPVHLRWLRRGFIVIFVATLGGGRWIQLVPEAGILRLNPFFIWRSSDVELALELVAAATRARFRQAGVEDSGRNQVRVARRAILERLWLAERLPQAEAMKTYWRQMLSEYPSLPI